VPICWCIRCNAAGEITGPTSVSGLAPGPTCTLMELQCNNQRAADHLAQDTRCGTDGRNGSRVNPVGPTRELQWRLCSELRRKMLPCTRQCLAGDSACVLLHLHHRERSAQPPHLQCGSPFGDAICPQMCVPYTHNCRHGLYAHQQSVERCANSPKVRVGLSGPHRACTQHDISKPL
jgi:hypothetical protein